MKIEKMWCVEDPGPVGELGDICYESDPKGLVHAAIGTYLSGDRDSMSRIEALTIYTEEAEARADAMARLAARDAAASDLPSTCRVWEICDSRVRLYESGTVQHWNPRVRQWFDGWGAEDIECNEDRLRHDEWRAAVGAYRSTPPTPPDPPARRR